MSRKRSVCGLIMVMVSVSVAQAEQQADVNFDPQVALTRMYGGKTWKDPRLAGFFPSPGSGKTVDVAYINLGFDATYMEGGHAKHVLVSLLTPEPSEQYGCHACMPLIGAAVFAKVGSEWQVEHESKVIADVAFGHKFTLVRVGPDRYAVQVVERDSHQGYELDRIDLLMAYGGKMGEALSVGFNENPSPDACGDGAPQSVDLTFDAAAVKEFYDVVVVVRKNVGECGHLKATVQKSRYMYTENGYRLVGQ